MGSQTLVLETDSDIIEEYTTTKSDRAATAFVRKYRTFVYSTALRYLKNGDDADDAAQEVFIKALKNLKNFRGNSTLKTWLYRITINVCSNIERKKKVKHLFRFGDDQEDYLNITAEDPMPDEKMEDSEFEENFMRILSGLPDKQRETFALRYFEEMSYEEISDMLGTSVGGLKANYYQAVKKLAEYLKKEM